MAYQVWICKRCWKSHDSEAEARYCCAPGILYRWCCSMCDEGFADELGAERCEAEHAAEERRADLSMGGYKR